MFIADIIGGAIKGALGEVIPQVTRDVGMAVGTAHNTPSALPLPQAVAQPVDSRELEAKILERVLASPQFQQVQQQTGAIPWYRSPVVTGLLTSLTITALGAAGVSLAPEDQAQVTALLTFGLGAIGTGVALWGRLWKPAQPVTVTAAGADAKNAR